MMKYKCPCISLAFPIIKNMVGRIVRDDIPYMQIEIQM